MSLFKAFPSKTKVLVQTAWETFKRAVHSVSLRGKFFPEQPPSIRQIRSFRERFPLASTSKILVFISSMSLRYKIAGTLIMVLALAIASLGAVTFSRQKKILREEMRKRAEGLVQHMANVGKEGLLTKQEMTASMAIKDLQQNPGVVYAMVVDNDGKVFAHNRLELRGQVLKEPADLASLGAGGLLFQQTFYNGEPVLEAVLPIVFKSKNLRLGTARVGISERELRQAIRQQKFVFTWISLGFVAIGLLISFGLSRVLTQPIYTLAVGMQVVAQGDLSQQVKVYYKDEIGKLTEAFNQMILSLREKLHMEKYLSNTTLQSIRLNRNIDRLKLGGEAKRVTALFSDVRGFTAMSERMRPEEVVQLLNIYLNFQGKVVHQRDGVVDKFVGDEVMAIFEGPDQEVNATRAAMEIQRYCSALNWARERTGLERMRLGVGINSGDVIMGNMGSEEQMNYTVIGDTINVAARLCGVAQAGQIVISPAVANALGKRAQLKKLVPVTLKGKEKLFDVFEVLEVDGASRKHMRRAMGLRAVYRLAGLEDDANPTLVRNLGPGGCLIETNVPVGVGARLVLELDAPPAANPARIQAVVRHTRKQDARYYVGVHFEGLSDDVVESFIHRVHRIESETLPVSPLPVSSLS